MADVSQLQDSGARSCKPVVNQLYVYGTKRMEQYLDREVNFIILSNSFPGT